MTGFENQHDNNNNRARTKHVFESPSKSPGEARPLAATTQGFCSSCVGLLHRVFSPPPRPPLRSWLPLLLTSHSATALGTTPVHPLPIDQHSTTINRSHVYCVRIANAHEPCPVEPWCGTGVTALRRDGWYPAATTTTQKWESIHKGGSHHRHCTARQYRTASRGRRIIISARFRVWLGAGTDDGT